MPATGAAGIASAVVTATEDPENRGRVKVRFPWLDSQTFESDWVPVAVPFGFDAAATPPLPAVGAEVFVGFLHGDFRQPVVLAQAYARL